MPTADPAAESTGVMQPPTHRVRSQMTLLILIFCLVLGIAFLAVAGALAWNQEQSIRRCVPTPGTIVGNAVTSRESTNN